ncbi:MAG: T9SS type A sorting domain-containing protein [Bacteroidetes bacterium]|nr:T9SS type A sorting domain-containing protein [Bacteroidota bacterium]
MKVLKTIICFMISLDAFSQVYEIPMADEQPAWVFPIWFEDANGSKDTLYFAYDADALDFGIPSSDVVFGEDFFEINPDSFNAVWDDIVSDEAYKVVVFKTISTPIIISFINAQLPLKVTWDNNLFYAENLPTPNNFPLPNAWGLIHCALVGFEGCQILDEDAIVLTDTPNYDVWGTFATDSLWFNSADYDYFVNYLDFEILEYGYAHGWMTLEHSIVKNENFSPNPTTDYIKLNSDYYIGGTILIFDLAGNAIVQYANITSNVVAVDNLPNGIYFLNYSNDRINLTQKFVKL